MRKRQIAAVAIALILCADALPFVSFSHEKEATSLSPHHHSQKERATATQVSRQSQKPETPLTKEKTLQEPKEKTHPQPKSNKGLFRPGVLRPL